MKTPINKPKKHTINVNNFKFKSKTIKLKKGKINHINKEPPKIENIIKNLIGNNI